jgi:hypothetical protein
LIVIGVAVYAGALVALRALDKEEWSIIRAGFGSRA